MRSLARCSFVALACVLLRPAMAGGGRLEQRPVFVLVSHVQAPECAAPDKVLLADEHVVRTLGKRFVSVTVDADERPDLADLVATAPLALDQEREPPEGPPWAVLTPDGWPFAAGRVRDDPVWRAAFVQRLEALAADWEDRRSQVAARAGAALHALRQAQTSEPPLRPLDRALVDGALRGLADAFDARRGTFGDALHGPLRLLREEADRGDNSAQRLLRRALATLALRELPRCGPPRLAEHALRLRALAHGHALTGDLALRAAAERLAVAAAASRDDSGAFAAGPGDARVFASANGLMIGALAVSSVALQRPGDAVLAHRAAEAVLARLGPPPTLRRAALGSAAGGPAFLADYAALAEGLLDLDAALPDRAARAEARRQAETLVEAAAGRFADPRGGFFDTDAAHEPLAARVRNGYDGERPSGNGLMAGVLLRLAAATGEERYRTMARRSVDAFLGDAQRAPRGLESLTAAAGGLVGHATATASARGEAVSAHGQAHARRGPVSVRLALEPTRARPGGALRARLALSVQDGYSVNAHRPRTRGLAGLSVSVLTPELRASAPLYPVPSDVPRRFAAEPALAHVGTSPVVVPLHVAPGSALGTLAVRVRVAFQACDARACQAPDSLVVEAPLEVVAR